MDRTELLTAIESRLGHRFTDRLRLECALTHSSFAHERLQGAGRPPAECAADDHYERFEFLGDAVLGLVISDLIMRRFPEAQEGELSRVRAGLVCCERLAERAQMLGLGEALRLGKGELATGGKDKASILAAAYEAVIAAVYLDAGFESARRMVMAHFQEIIETTPAIDLLGDYKTPLQELVQAASKTTPAYRVAREEGPDHMKVFEVEVFVNGECLARGRGRSKKEAEQDAARSALACRKWD